MTRWVALAAVLMCGAAFAQDAQLHGLLDLRVVAAPSEAGWTEGGLGKTRWGDGDSGVQLGAAVLEARWHASPSLTLFADAQGHLDDAASLELVEAYARWRPVSTSAWRFSAKAGEYFPPVSYENEGVGWTSPWTLSSSVINTWIGEELRNFGAELRLERRGEGGSLEAAASLFEGSDPAGELMAARGWSVGDLVLGPGARTREPDVYAQAIYQPAPRRYNAFQEIDHQPGWTGELTWRAARLGRVTLLRFDNRADSTQEGVGEVYAWRTYFTSVAAETRVGPLTLVAQGMDGGTELDEFDTETEFGSAFLLAAWEQGAWRPALRVEAFSTHADPASVTSEHGNAVTAALNWRPQPWLRLVAEALRVDSVREQRMLGGAVARSTRWQGQLAARVSF